MGLEFILKKVNTILKSVMYYITDAGDSETTEKVISAGTVKFAIRVVVKTKDKNVWYLLVQPDNKSLLLWFRKQYLNYKLIIKSVVYYITESVESATAATVINAGTGKLKIKFCDMQRFILYNLY